jgi:hypothetical protein
MSCLVCCCAITFLIVGIAYLLDFYIMSLLNNQNESNSSRPTSSGQPMPIPEASMPQNTNRIASAARPESTTRIQTIIIREENVPVRV